MSHGFSWKRYFANTGVQNEILKRCESCSLKDCFRNEALKKTFLKRVNCEGLWFLIKATSVPCLGFTKGFKFFSFRQYKRKQTNSEVWCRKHTHALKCRPTVNCDRPWKHWSETWNMKSELVEGQPIKWIRRKRSYMKSRLMFCQCLILSSVVTMQLLIWHCLDIFHW